MSTNYVESSLKRFLKRKVKVTLGLVVAFMITGTVGYAADIVIGETERYEVNENGEYIIKTQIIDESPNDNIKSCDINGNKLVLEKRLYIGKGAEGSGIENKINIIDSKGTGTLYLKATLGRNGTINVGKLIVNAKEAEIGGKENGITTGYSGEKLEINANEIEVGSTTNGIYIGHPNDNTAKGKAELIVNSNNITIDSTMGIRNNFDQSILTVTSTDSIKITGAKYGINDSSSGGKTSVTTNRLEISIEGIPYSKMGTAIYAGGDGSHTYVKANNIITHKYDENTCSIGSINGGKVYINCDENGNKIEGNYLLELEGDIKVGEFILDNNNELDGQGFIKVDLENEKSYLIGGISTAISQGTEIEFSKGTHWYNTKNSDAYNLTLKEMTVNMSEHGQGGQDIEITNNLSTEGSSTFVMDISGNDISHENKETDFLKIKNVDGTTKHYVQLSQNSIENLSNHDFANEEKAVWFADTDKDMILEGKKLEDIANVYSYTPEIDTDVRPSDVSENGQNYYVTGLKKEESKVTETVTDDMSYLYNAAISRLEIDTLHKRLGEIRNYKNADGIWFRTIAGEQTSDVSNSSFENDYYMLQVGYDKRTVSDKGDWYTGFAVSRRENDIDYRHGNGESENIGISLYKSFAGKNDTYLDLIGRYTFIDNEYKLFNENSMMKADYDTWAATASIEYGKKYSDKDSEWYMTPHVQLNYTYINGENYTTSSNVKVNQDDINSLIGRVGVYAGRDFEKSSHYLKASVLREFLGDYGAEITGADSSLNKELDGGDTWFEVGVGGNIQLGDSGTTHMYYDFEKTFESDFETEWQATLGIRFSFNKISELFEKKAPAPKPVIALKADNYFDFDKSELKEKGKEVIKQTSEIINQRNLEGTLLIEGHTDWTGSEEYNQILSEKRAKMIEKTFKENIKSENIKYETKGYGETKPIADNKTSEGRARNRRVEIKYQGK